MSTNSNNIQITPTPPYRHPKTGPRKILKGDNDKFTYGYMGIDWSAKGPPVCELCLGLDSDTCAACG